MMVRFRFVLALGLVILLALFVGGCATVEPGRMFPREHGSRVAEKTWLALDTIDTMQTVQIARNPSCFREANPVAASLYGSDHPSGGRVVLTNALLGLVHSKVSRWFDDRVAIARVRDDDSVGPWYVGRIAWHAVSLVGTSAAVANNFSQGINPTSARCP